MKVQLGGLIPGIQYAFNVFESGDITNGCKNIGKVFNPNPPPKRSGIPPKGYIGRTEADREGYIYLSFLERPLSCIKGNECNVVGRSCSLHRISDGDEVTIDEVISDRTLIACSNLTF